MEDAAEGYAEIDIVPAQMNHLRACLSCSLVKTEQQFYESGCESELCFSPSSPRFPPRHTAAPENATSSRLSSVVHRRMLKSHGIWYLWGQTMHFERLCVEGCFCSAFQIPTPSETAKELLVSELI